MGFYIEKKLLKLPKSMTQLFIFNSRIKLILYLRKRNESTIKSKIYICFKMSDETANNHLDLQGEQYGRPP